MALANRALGMKPSSTVERRTQALGRGSVHTRRGVSSRGHLVVTNAAAPTRQQMSAQMKQVRSQMEEDEQLKVLMDGLRGRNADTRDFAAANVKMNLVEVHHSADETDSLPLTYEPDLIADYWSRRPVSVITRITQLMGIAGGFLGRLAFDAMRGQLKETEVARAVELRDIMTSLGPAYIKLGQALSIRPDLLSPAAMNELQKLCDKVPSFPTPIAMQVLQDELGAPWQDIYSELTPEPIAAASLGQVYKGKLHTGEVVAVKVQRPGVLETVTIDLYIIRSLGMVIRQYAPDITKRADIVALLDEWASRFFEELDYVKEGQNANKFAEQMRIDLPQVVVPATYETYTSRRVLTTEWLDGEKLSQSTADDVGALVNVGVICYLKQLLETGFFHADPHPGNLIRTPDGRLAILDFGLMTQVDDDIKFGMIEAISHLIHRDYDAIVKDFVTLDFIPEDTDLQPILPVLAKVFDSALEGGGAKSINFQDLAADLAQITFDYPFRIPPYFALIIRAISTLEGIALVGNPDFAIVDEAYPYIARRLLTDPSPRLREALRYMVYGKSNVFDADRLIDLLSALEDFQVNSRTAMGDTVLVSAQDVSTSTAGGSNGARQQTQQRVPFSTPGPAQESVEPSFPFPFPLPLPPLPFPGSTQRTPFPLPDPAFGLALLDASPVGQVLARSLGTQDATGAFVGPFTASLSALSGATGLSAPLTPTTSTGSAQTTREALRFMLSPEGLWFREFVMDEIVKSIDALSRDQLYTLAAQLGLQGVTVPLLLPGAKRSTLPLTPPVSEEDRQVVTNVTKIVTFLTKGRTNTTTVTSVQETFSAVGEEVTVTQQTQQTTQGGVVDTSVLVELLPMLPSVAREVVPEVSQRLASRIMARLVRDIYA